MRVLVLTAPCLHLGYVGCYGSDWVHTPHLDSLAAEGIVFDQHYADCPGIAATWGGPVDPRPGPTWWTGRYHFPDCAGQPETPAESPRQLLPLLEAHGIATAYGSVPGRMGAVGATSFQAWPTHFMAEALGRLGSGDRWLLWMGLPGLAPPWSVAPELLGHFFAEEGDQGGEPLVPWLDPPCGLIEVGDGRALERLQRTYAAAVTHWDAGLGILLDELRQRDLYENLMLVLTSDQGLSLGEHGGVGPSQPWLHEEVLHLPLLLRLPGGAKAGRRIPALTQPVDLFPTLMEAFGLTPPEGHGRNLLPLTRSEVNRARDYACAGWTVGGAVGFALRTPAWGLLVAAQRGPANPPRRPQLYIKPDDRWEVNDVWQHHLEWAEGLEKTLRGFVAATRMPGPLVPPALPDWGRMPVDEPTG